MNDRRNETMNFTSEKYTDIELQDMGVAGRKRITCRKVDIGNPHFINYHLHDMFTNAHSHIKDHDAYIIEMGDSDTHPEVGRMEILFFATRMHRDKFVFINHENFKMTDNDGIIKHEELALQYLN